MTLGIAVLSALIFDQRSSIVPRSLTQHKTLALTGDVAITAGSFIPKKTNDLASCANSSCCCLLKPRYLHVLVISPWLISQCLPNSCRKQSPLHVCVRGYNHMQSVCLAIYHYLPFSNTVCFIDHKSNKIFAVVYIGTRTICLQSGFARKELRTQ